MKERRKYRRFAFDSRADLVVGDHVWNTRVLDISLRGALLARPPDLEEVDVGDYVEITIGLETGAKMMMEALLVRIDNNRLGCRCDGIEWISHCEKPLLNWAFNSQM